MTVSEQKNFIIKALFYAVAAALLYFGLRLLAGPLLPFAIAAALAVSLQSIIRKWVRKFRLKKKPASVALIIAIYVVVGALLFWLFRALYSQLTDLITTLPEYSQSISEAFSSISEKFSSFFGNGMLEDIPEAALTTVAEKAAELVTSLAADFAAGVPGFLLSLAVTVIASAYIAKDYDEISRFIVRSIPKTVADKLLFVKDVMLKKLAKLFRGYLIIIVMTFCELLVGLLLLRVRYALIIAAVTALVDILPVLGSGTVLIPWAVVSALTGNTARAVGLVILYIIITAVRNVTEPKIIGAKLGVHPVLMLASVFLGLRLFGASGVLLAPIVIVAVKSLLENRDKTTQNKEPSA